MIDGVLGYTAYKLADSVTTHEGWGFGSYCFFNVDPSIHATRSFEVPVTPGVRLHDLLTVSLGGVGTIDHVVNDTGAAQRASTMPANNVIISPSASRERVAYHVEAFVVDDVTPNDPTPD